MYYKHRISLTHFDREYLQWYFRKVANKGTPFDPRDLASLTRQQHPNKPEWAAAIARCTREWQADERYTYFISWPARQGVGPCKYGFQLQHPTIGKLIVDALEDGRVVGMEYLDRVISRSVGTAPTYAQAA